MEKSRCIFCMNQTEGAESPCPVCKKGIWEYRWKAGWLEPYTRIQEKYLVGAALKERGNHVCYLAYDMVLEQKVLLYEYPKSFWNEEIKQRAALLFGRSDLPGMASVMGFFELGESGYVVTVYHEGQNLREYRKAKGRVTEGEAAKLLLPVAETLTVLHGAGMVLGNVEPEHLIFAEDGRLVLEADCQNHVSETDNPYAAPEQLHPNEAVGPWTDLYSLCAVWYELLTGYAPLCAERRQAHDRLKNPSIYAAVEARTEQALMQGLSLEPGLRFFSIGNFLESLGLSNPKFEQTADVLRAAWGETWLEMAQKSETKSRKKARYGYLRRRLLTAGILLVCLAGLGAGGVYIYLQTHQEQYFEFVKHNWAAQAERNHPYKACLTKKDPEYEAVREFVEEYGRADRADLENTESRNIYYEISEEDVEFCPAQSSTVERFYLDYDTAKEAAAYYMGIQGELEPLDSSLYSFYGTICVDTDEEEKIGIFLDKTEGYKGKNSDERLEFQYDLLDNGLLNVKFDGTKERCAYFLEKMLPFLAPEVSLTAEETQELVERDFPEGEDTLWLHPNAHYEVRISNNDSFDGEDPERISVEIEPVRSLMRDLFGYYIQNPEDETSYAGNYERGSSRYEEYTAYVKEHAFSQKETQETSESSLDSVGGVTYTLEKDAVLKWGEPCNNFRFFVQAEELVEYLKGKGYSMKKLLEKENNTVEIQKYGGIVTYFGLAKEYQMEDGIHIRIVEDLVNGEVMQIEIFREEDSDQELYQAAVDAAALMEERADQADFVQSVQDGEESAKEAGGGTFVFQGNLTFQFETYENVGIGISIMPGQSYDGKPYYWP